MPASEKKGTRGTYILVVEDCTDQRELLRHTLSGQNYVVDVASNGQDALAKIRAQKPDILLSDIQMPEMDGFELCRVVKKDPLLNDIPVVLLTAMWDVKSLVLGLQSGADFYFSKPMDRKSLLSRTAAIVSEGAVKIQEKDEEVLEIEIEGDRHIIHLSRRQILRHLISTYEIAVQEKERNLSRQLKSKEANPSEQKVESRFNEMN